MAPENFGGRTYGRMRLADAFAQSVNTAAVRLAMDVGINEVISAARDLGIDAQLPSMPSLALGAVEVSLLDLTAAFGSVHAGRGREPWGVAALGAENESRLRTVGPHVGSEQTLGPHRQPLIDLLRLVVERGTGRAAALDGFAAGKTGTSQNHRDAWFIGFNDALVVGVWVGNDDGRPMDRVVGGTLPATIWKRFMTEAANSMAPQIAPSAELPETAAQHEPPGPGPAQAEAAAQQLSRQEPEPEPSDMDQSACDYRRCASTYRSFRASDCTYQPYSGPRQICEMGGSIEPREQASKSLPQERSKATCNIEVCAEFYNSFDSSDCSYQPFGGGPRRICDR